MAGPPEFAAKFCVEVWTDVFVCNCNACDFDLLALCERMAFGAGREVGQDLFCQVGFTEPIEPRGAKWVLGVVWSAVLFMPAPSMSCSLRGTKSSVIKLAKSLIAKFCLAV